MNKYYTPDLEEFHVGFEYEILYKGETEWEKKCFKGFFGRITSILNEENLDDKIRVKYLDSTDIEELGWEIYKEHVSEDISAIYYKSEKVGKYGLTPENGYTLHLKHTRSPIWDRDENVVGQSSEVIVYFRNEELELGHKNVTYFNGQIKNKSELIKLLKQLELNEFNK